LVQLSKNQDLIAKIRWDCRRGMLELDYVFDYFIKDGLNKLNDNELVEFQKFLDNQDPDLFAWFLGFQKPDDEFSAKWVAIVLESQPKNK